MRQFRAAAVARACATWFGGRVAEIRPHMADGSLESLRSLDASPREDAYDLVLIDLQGMPDDPALLVARVRTAIPGRDATAPRVVAFGPHVATARLDQARAAGVDAAVSRGELLGGFPALVRRWCPRP